MHWVVQIFKYLLSQGYLSTLTLIFMVIAICYMHKLLIWGRVHNRDIFVRFCPVTYHFLNSCMLNGDGQDIHMLKYLKSIGFINPKIIIFKIGMFLTL